MNAFELILQNKYKNIIHLTEKHLKKPQIPCKSFHYISLPRFYMNF